MSFTLNKSIRSKPVQREELGEAGERRIGPQQRQPAHPALGRAVGGFRQRQRFKDVLESKRTNDTKNREAQLPLPSPSPAKGAGETQTRGFQGGVCAANVPRHHGTRPVEGVLAGTLVLGAWVFGKTTGSLHAHRQGPPGAFLLAAIGLQFIRILLIVWQVLNFTILKSETSQRSKLSP